ncbi:hypothetical protein scyTo_0017203 [Scyliorhinus torazame]|uniref:Sema domain-containing protein n=1 Tax=Scyliorhinus torazame TaxID=75743 RepID=A0A401Q584_SCYTO|nr:hypothetical protein [Scyliorhinus torazame]
MAPLWNCLLLYLLTAQALAAQGRTLSNNPRLKMSYKDLVSRGAVTYQLDYSCCYNTLLLDEERGKLFVGSKNYLIALNLENISKQDKQIYWPAPVEWREECNWAGKDLHVSKATANCPDVLRVDSWRLARTGPGSFVSCSEMTPRPPPHPSPPHPRSDSSAPTTLLSQAIEHR